MKVKKVLIVYSGAKHQGGIERYLENLFSLYSKKRIELVLVSLGEWPLAEKVRQKGGKSVVLSGVRINLKTFFDISKIAKKENADLIVSQGVVANFYARGAAKMAGIPSLTTVHSDMKLDYSNSLIRFLYSVSDKISRPITTHYIAVSEFLKNELAKSGVAKDKVSVVYDGVEIANLENNEKSGEIIIGSVGRLHKVKGYENLIRAFSLINSTGLRLLIWGEGQERENLEKLIGDLGLKEKTELVGYTENIEEALSMVDLYIQPSLAEGFGLTVVEAMLAGKPVIVTPVGSLKEIVTDSKTGIITKSTSPKSLARAIEKTLSDAELMKRVGEDAVKDVRERFSIEKWVRDTEKVYMETAK